MRNKIVYLVMAGTLMLTGCSGASTAGDTESQAEMVEASESDAEDVETNAEADAQGADSEQEAAEDGELMPSSFVETVAGKTDFASYDEIISYLKKGQGYAYIKLKGYNGDILAITESVYTDNNENHSTDVSLYGEKDGVDYFFISKEEFEKRLKEGKFVESSLYNGNYYGCGKDQVDDNKVIVLDPNGLHAFQALNDPHVITVLLLCDDKTREERMVGRGDKKEKIEERLKNDQHDFALEKVSGVHLVVHTENKNIDQVADEIYSFYQSKMR